MPGCGYCRKSKTLLQPFIDNKTITVKHHTDAPDGISGFPHFVNTLNNETHTGYPGSVDNLFNILKYPLDIEEGFSLRHTSRLCAFRDWEGVL